MAYITLSNAKKLIRKLDENTLDSTAESIYKRDIYFFSKRESANIKGIRELFKGLENFALEFYKPIVVTDSYRYLTPENQPAYHRDSFCERLVSNFRNIEVPVPIQEKGKEEVMRFRAWYNNTEFKEDNTTDYIFKLQLKFPYVGAINPKAIDFSNSGAELKRTIH